MMIISKKEFAGYIICDNEFGIVVKIKVAESDDLSRIIM